MDGRTDSGRREREGSEPRDKEERGFGGSAQAVLAPYAEFGVNYARGLVDVIDDKGGLNAESSYDITSMGGFANVRVIEDLVIGAGVNKTNKLNQKKTPTAAMASSDIFRGSAPSNTWSRSSCTSSWSPPTRSRISDRPSRPILRSATRCSARVCASCTSSKPQGAPRPKGGGREKLSRFGHKLDRPARL